MAHPVADALAYWLTDTHPVTGVAGDNTIGPGFGTIGDDIHVDYLPNDPDEATSLNHTSGTPEYTFACYPGNTMHRVQVASRGTNYEEARWRALTVHFHLTRIAFTQLLVAVPNPLHYPGTTPAPPPINVHILAVRADDIPIFTSHDDRERTRFDANYSVWSENRTPLGLSPHPHTVAQLP